MQVRIHVARLSGMSSVDAQGAMWVEFFGLPGAGKTTIAQALAARLKDGDVLYAPDLLADSEGKAARLSAKLGIIAREAPRGSDLALFCRAVTLAQPKIRDRVRAGLTLATVSALYRRLERQGRSALLDQGYLQALWTVLFRGDDRAARRLIEEVMPRLVHHGRVYISVEAPPAQCRARLAQRNSKHSRLQDGSISDLPNVWDTAEAQRKALWSALSQAAEAATHPPRLLSVDGMADPAETAERIARWLGEDASG